MTRIDYDGRRFRSLRNSQTGEVDDQTRFEYRQQGGVVWATYEGGAIRFGTLIATVAPDGVLDMRYQHVNAAGELMTGRCRSTPSSSPTAASASTSAGSGRAGTARRGSRWSRRCWGEPLPQSSYPRNRSRSSGVGSQQVLLPAEPAVAVAGNEAVEPIAEGPGDHPQGPQHLPGAAQAAGDAEGGVALLEPAVPLDQDDAVHGPGIDPEAAEKLLPRRRLEGGEAEAPRRIVPKDELDRPVAEVADVVEEDDGVRGLHPDPL